MNNKENGIFNNNVYILKLIYKLCPGRIFATFFRNAVSYSSWVFYSVIFVKYIMSAIETDKDFSSIVYFIIISAIIFGAMEYFNKWYDTRYLLKSNNIIYKKANDILFNKAASVDLSCYTGSPCKYLLNYSSELK